MCTTKTKKLLGNNSWFFPSHEFIFILIHEFFFDFFLAKNVKIRKIFTHGYSYNNQNILTWMNLLEWSSYMHISLCVVSVMAAAAADFPRLAKWLAAANLRQHTSESSSFMFCLIFVGYLVATDAIATFLTAWHFFYLLVFLVDNDTYYNVLSIRYVTYCSCFTFIEPQ